MKLPKEPRPRGRGQAPDRLKCCLWRVREELSEGKGAPGGREETAEKKGEVPDARRGGVSRRELGGGVS